jgi:preprotein translocase subunit SecD
MWKYALILCVLLLGAVYAIPNIYPDDPALQVSGARSSIVQDSRLQNRVLRILDEAGIQYLSSEIGEKNLLVRFADNEAQLRAKTVVASALGDDYLVALNLAPTTPDWLVNIGAYPMKLGLDLRGGVHFLMEVDMEKALTRRLDVYASEIKGLLREEKVRYRQVEALPDGSITVTFTKSEIREQAVSVLRNEYREFRFEQSEDDSNFYLKATLLSATLKQIEAYALQQNLTTIRNRVNELGVAEPLVQRQGGTRIVVELPGIQDATLAKKIIGATANLEFRLEAKQDELRSRTEIYEFRNKANRQGDVRVEKDIIVTGDSVSNANASFDENGQPQVNITLDSKGGKLMNRVTRNAVGRGMVVLFLEYPSRVIGTEVVNGKVVEKRKVFEEKSIISLATIQTSLGNQFRITGLDSPAESSELALLLRAGSLAAPIYFVEERTVGPSLGQENIDLGVKSVQIGLLLVLAFMLLYYRVFGLFANIALTVNLMLLIAVMSILSATLTLPGIAGIVLTVGMAVDANVLIFSRIKEEIKGGSAIQTAIHAGYERAFQTIFDANITTLLVAVILFAVGTGPIKGFAVTLSIGILTSMFTAIVLTRAMVNLTYGGRAKVKKLWI